ncbi:MAG: hypothetical protein U0136_02280 [Bdellovibrionota bacterium]
MTPSENDPIKTSTLSKTSEAFSPSHLTGFFQIFENGSTGAGANTVDGARTRVTLHAEAAKPARISVNGAVAEAPVSRKVIELFGDLAQSTSLTIEHSILSPIGYGLGMSGAGAFSLTLALNDVLGEPLSYHECMELAVRAEIASGTGLGDVVAQQFHGVMIGLPPYPSRAVENIPTDGEQVVCAFFGPLETKKIIRDSTWRDKINQVGAECMADLLRNRTLPNLMSLCRRFTLETGLASPELRNVLAAVPTASMAMLGQTAFILTKDVETAKKQLSQFTDRIQVSALSETGAAVVRSAS